MGCCRSFVAFSLCHSLMQVVLLCLLFAMLPQAFRGRQADPAFQWDPPGAKKPLSLANIIVAGAVVVVQQCSGQALRIPHTYGRPEATAADSEIDKMLPSPDSIIEDIHFSVFQQMVSLVRCCSVPAVQHGTQCWAAAWRLTLLRS
jgi:hypothetical protein